MLLADVLRVGFVGVRAHPARSILSAAGIAIGIAAMVAVVSVSASSAQALDERLEKLGSNVLSASREPSQTDPAADDSLPGTAPAMARRVSGVADVSAVSALPTHVYRTDLIPAGNTNGLSVLASDDDVPATVNATIGAGRWLAKDRRGLLREVVLGSDAATLMGLTSTQGHYRVRIGTQWFRVVGIMAHNELLPELDGAVFVTNGAATEALGLSVRPTRLFVRADPRRLDAVRGLLPRAVSPQSPQSVAVSRPSDLVAARLVVADTLSSMFIGLGVISLLVGGIGVTNTMVISVLERRSEIALRRALGAARRHVCVQFLAESLIMSLLGGTSGVLTGAATAWAFSQYRDWPLVVPAWAQAAGIAVTVVIGGLAGLYPALRASFLAPADELTG